MELKASQKFTHFCILFKRERSVVNVHFITTTEELGYGIRRGSAYLKLPDEVADLPLGDGPMVDQSGLDLAHICGHGGGVSSGGGGGVSSGGVSGVSSGGVIVQQY